MVATHQKLNSPEPLFLVDGKDAQWASLAFLKNCVALSDKPTSCCDQARENVHSRLDIHLNLQTGKVSYTATCSSFPSCQ